MEYNTSRENIIYPEYGRNIQKLVTKISLIQNTQIRNKYANSIIDLMEKLNKKIKNKFLNYKKKLWVQLFFISKQKIKINKKYKIKRKFLFQTKKKDRHIELMKKKIKISKFYNKKYKYYGINIINFFKKKIIFFNKIKIKYICNIANYMKKNYIRWNKTKYVDDIKILQDIKNMSKGKINLFSFL
ncbi:MAG: DUF4290 domain-containing protein [Candidatus Shikimatogenerans bostrichidophilus]|nr:MAG: DUF4290 domain-containing protein [Candidatus Shikimatogenerans bostrichidophilus]